MTRNTKVMEVAAAGVGQLAHLTALEGLTRVRVPHCANPTVFLLYAGKKEEGQEKER
jgi:hypothetical protein